MKILFTIINVLVLVLISSSLLFAEEQLSHTKLNENVYDEIQQENTVQWREATGTTQWTRREDTAFLSHNDQMWIISGDDGGSPHPNDVWLSDNGTNWTLATDTAPWTGRRDFVGLVYGEKMWIIGGIAMLYERLGDVWCSNDGTNWTQSTAEAPWAARGQHSGVVYNGKMWIFGGLDNSVNKNDVWCSTDGSNWTCVTTGAPWAARRGHASVVYDNKMWIMGGYGSGGLKNDVWWSTDGTNWSEATSSANWTPRQYIGVTAYDGVMWVTGGGLDGSWEANDVWCSTNGATWILDSEHASWVTRYGHALLVHKERMWLAGGGDVNTGQRLNDVWFSDIVPDPPQNVQAGDGDYADKVIITWNNSTGATKYIVYRNTTDTTNGAENISDEITGTSFDDPTAKPCETYYYWVKSGYYNGWSDFSDSDSGYAKTPAPTDINASDGTYTSKVEVTWNSYFYITNGLIGYWKFNDSNTIVDSSVNGWTATNMGTTFSSSGKLNGACYFDGNSDIRLNAPILTNLPVTIELWAKPAETQPVTLQGYYTIMNNDKPFSGGHGIGINKDRGLYLNRRGWDTEGWTTGYTLPSEVWTHIAVVLEATQITLYTNGVIYDTWSHSSTEGRACGELFTRVGLRNEGSTDRFKGYMDEIRVWRGVRSGDEIASNFENELSSDGLKHTVYRNTINDNNSASDISGEIADTSFDDTTAVPGQTYYYWVKSKCNNSWSDFSDSDSGYKHLLAATGVSASDGDYTDKVEVTWNASIGATKYMVYRNTTDTTNGAEDISGEIKGTSFNDTTAIPYTTYYYWIKAGSDSCWSDLSDSDSGYKLLSIPTSVSASDGDYTDKVEITWDVNTGATKYMVYRNTTDTTNGAENISGEITGAGFDDTTADPGQTYYYWVKNGCDNGWSDFSDSDSGYKQLSMPTGIFASDGDYTDKVEITWDISTGATKYMVYRSTANTTNNVENISSEITGTSFDDTTADPGQTYYYWVKNGCDNGWSNFSDSDSGYKQLSMPTGIFASDGDYTNKVEITWPASTGATKYKIYRNTIDNNSSASDISGEIADTSFDDTTAIPGQTYYYWVKAGSDSGWSDFSDSDSGYKRLSIPTGVSATDGIYNDKVIITWSNVPYALTYIIYRSELNIASNATLLGQSVTNNIYSDSTVIPCKKYFYWIEANAAAGNSNLSESDSGFAFVSQGEPETEGKWKYKSKNGKAKLKVKNMGMDTPLANYLEDGCLVGLKNASNYETVDGPHKLEPLKKKTGEVKKWVYAVKRNVTIKYIPKNDQLIYKVWKNLPTEIIFFVVPPAETAQNASESDGLPVPVFEIYLQPGEKAGNGWKLLNPALIKSN